MKKKLLSVLLCATMAVSMMAGCGNGGDTTDPTPTTAPTTAPTEAPADPTAAPTEAPAPTEVPTAEALPEPVYYFPFDDATGLSPRMNTTGSTMDERVYLAEDVEFAFTNGVKGDCLWLDGTFGAQVDGIEPLNKETYTISFWSWASRLSQYSTTLQYGNGMATGTTEHWLSFTTLDTSFGYPAIWSRWQPETGNVQPICYYKDETTLGRKKWAHFCLVVDETETVENSGAVIIQAQLYVDGVPSENVIQVVPGVFTGDKATTDWRFLIGVNPWDKIFKGCIDELYIFDEALTPGQVATLYADGDGTSVPLKSTEPEPEVIRDYTALAPSGTVIGAQDGSSVYGDAYSEIAEVGVGETVAVKFKNYVPSKLNDAGKNVYDFANTFSLILQNVAEGHSTADNADYKEYAVIAGSEGFEWAAKKSDLNVTRNTFHQFNPENFTTDSDMANFTVAITNYGTTAKVAIKASCVDGIIRYIDVEEIPVDGPLFYTFTTNGSFIDIAADDAAYGAILGNMDCSTPWWSTWTETIKVEPGTSSKLHFKNYTSGIENWHNFVVVLQNMADAHSSDPAAAIPNDPGYKEYAALRADNYGWGDGYAAATLECNWVWDTFKSDMNGADVILEVINNGTTADVIATVTTKGGAVYTQKYLGVAIDGDLYYCLTCESAYLEVLGTPVGNLDKTTGWWSTWSDTVKVEAGTTERVYFKNYTSGIENWHNFVVVLQNMADAHSADPAATIPNDPGYVEYAALRADNYGWGNGYATATLECNWVWDTFKSDMDGADIIMDIVNHGTTVDVLITAYTKTGSVYTQKYLGIAVDGDVYYCLTCEQAFLDIIGTTVGNLDCSTGWWSTWSDTVKVEAGETANVKFRNYTSGIENWHNFVVVLQNMADVHSADTAAAIPNDPGYVEYAALRADNYGWGNGYATATLECDWVWDTFKADMNGALVDLNITNNGSTADVVATVTTANGTVYTQKYLGIAIDGDLYYCLTCEQAWLAIFE